MLALWNVSASLDFVNNTVHIWSISKILTWKMYSEYQFSKPRKYMHFIDMLNCNDWLTDFILTTGPLIFPSLHCRGALDVSVGPVTHNRSLKMPLTACRHTHTHTTHTFHISPCWQAFPPAQWRQPGMTVPQLWGLQLLCPRQPSRLG